MININCNKSHEKALRKMVAARNETSFVRMFDNNKDVSLRGLIIEYEAWVTSHQRQRNNQKWTERGESAGDEGSCIRRQGMRVE